MIVVDTNVLSEPLKRRPCEAVLTWLDEHRREITMTAITVGELIYGAARLPDGRRRDGIIGAVDNLVAEMGDALAGYDVVAARRYGALRAEREAAGRPASVEDMMIAAIALRDGHSVATRNVTDFEGFGLDVINPFEPA